MNALIYTQELAKHVIYMRLNNLGILNCEHSGALWNATMPVQNGITTEEAWNKVEGTQNYNINVAQIANFPYSCDLLGNLIKQSNISTFESVRQCSDISLISIKS